jgi:chromosome segregation ATPase
MPSNFLYIDTNFPTFTGEETSKEQIDSMLNYLRILVEQLRYTLNNLDMTNFNSKAILDWSEASKEDIQQELVTLATQLNQTNQTVAGLSRRVSNLEGLQTRVADAEEAIEELQDTDRDHGTRLTAAEGDIDDLQAASLAQQQSIADLTVADSAQVQRIAALETWKTGAVSDLSGLRTDVNAATAAAAANAALISGLRTDVTNIGNDVTALIEEMAQLKESISVDDSGNAIFGKTGQRTDIKGDVYINGLPYVPGGTT